MIQEQVRLPVPRFDQPAAPMTIRGMRRLGPRSLDVSCLLCHHQAIMDATAWPHEIPVPSFGSRKSAPAAGSPAPTRGRIGMSTERRGGDP